METVRFFTFGVARDVINFADMACEKSSRLKQEALSSLVRPIFVLVSGCFALYQGKALFDRLFYRISQGEESFYEKIGPSLANMLNMAAGVAVVVYYFGLTVHPAVFVLGNAYRLVPYATNIFCHFKDFKDLRNICGLFSPVAIGQARFDDSFMENITTNLESYIKNTKGMVSEVGETLKDILPKGKVLNEIDRADSTTTLFGEIQKKVKALKERLEGIETFDLCLNLTSFVLGVAYVALMCQYGVVPGELAFYAFLFFHIVYDLWKKYYLITGLRNNLALQEVQSQS